MRALTITTSNLYAGATFLDPHGRATVTNGHKLNRCRISDVVIDAGFDKTLGVT